MEAADLDKLSATLAATKKDGFEREVLSASARNDQREGHELLEHS